MLPFDRRETRMIDEWNNIPLFTLVLNSQRNVRKMALARCTHLIPFHSPKVLKHTALINTVLFGSQHSLPSFLAITNSIALSVILLSSFLPK